MRTPLLTHKHTRIVPPLTCTGPPACRCPKASEAAIAQAIDGLARGRMRAARQLGSSMAAVCVGGGWSADARAHGRKAPEVGQRWCDASESAITRGVFSLSEKSLGVRTRSVVRIIAMAWIPKVFRHSLD